MEKKKENQKIRTRHNPCLLRKNLANKNEAKGITLIALVITIIVLLILAAISIATLTGDNGILTKAQNASEKTKETSVKEEIEIEIMASFDDMGNLDEKKFKDKMEKLGAKITKDTEDEIVVEKDGYEATIDVKTGEIKSYKNEQEVTPVEFTTAQGKIDVIWINTENKKIDAPLVPDTLPNGMMKVYWEGVNEIREYQENGEKNPNFKNENWYKYVEGNNKEDTKESKWANAINTTTDGEESYDSYFVWIPRYAYRITYLSEDGRVVGYCDGDGIRDASGNKHPDPQEPKEGIETVEYNGFKYIVHPAFEGNIENGGWKDEEKGIEDLKGIWVGKYESAHSNATDEDEGSGEKIQIVPTVKSWVDVKVGNCYTYAKDYDQSKESHLIKNSEWGAISYLTHSQYGRNGKEVSINGCNNVVTGMGSGDSTNNYSYNSELERLKYNGENGMLSSSTGNIYGVYDLSGGAYEYVAAFNNEGKNLINGSVFAGTDGNSSDSTKYSTKYTSDSQTPTYEKYYPGDATYEIYKESDSLWFSDASVFICPSEPFFLRGGYFGRGENARRVCFGF